MDQESQFGPNNQKEELALPADSEKKQQIAAVRLSLALGFSALAAFGFMLVRAFPELDWMQAGNLTIILLIISVSVISFLKNRKEWNVYIILVMLGVLWFGFTGFTLLNSGLGIILAFGIFTLTIGLAVELLPFNLINRSILIGTGIGSGIFLLDLLVSYPRIDIAPQLHVLQPFIVFFELLILILYLVRNYLKLPLLSKIFVPLVAVTLFSVGIVFASKSSILVLVFVTIFVFIATYLVAVITTTPVIRLVNEVRGMELANSGGQLYFVGKDETAILSALIKTIAEKLKQSMVDLERHTSKGDYELPDTSTQAQKRSRQLEAISEISRVITTERDLQKLLPLVTRMISEKLGFYHAGIFLIDRQGEYAVLRAANSEGGQNMLKRGHRLQVGQQGIIGYVTGTGNPRVALDVGEDAVFFNNPDLPHTRSEIGLPLTLGDQLIGALDVQSTEAGAFSEEDVHLLSTLADQVTIAIDNARLFSETEQALQESQEIQRAYLREQWDRQIELRHNLGFIYEDGRLYPLPSNSEQQTGLTASEASPSRLSIPISLRDEVIGYIDLQQVDDRRIWTEEEIGLAHAVAQQIGLALENARLIEETQRRAERESLVSQITTRLRASTDQQAILQTAVSELRNALRVRTTHVVIPAQNSEPARHENLAPSFDLPVQPDQNDGTNSDQSPQDSDEGIG